MRVSPNRVVRQPGTLKLTGLFVPVLPASIPRQKICFTTVSIFCASSLVLLMGLAPLNSPTRDLQPSAWLYALCLWACRTALLVRLAFHFALGRSVAWVVGRCARRLPVVPWAIRNLPSCWLPGAVGGGPCFLSALPLGVLFPASYCVTRAGFLTAALPGAVLPACRCAGPGRFSLLSRLPVLAPPSSFCGPAGPQVSVSSGRLWLPLGSLCSVAPLCAL